MTALVERPDLSTRDPRKAISKSWLVGADLCGSKGWLSIHKPMPWRPVERVTFGSAVDAGVEVMLKAVRAGGQVPWPTIIAAVNEVAERPDSAEFDHQEALAAIHAFGKEVAPRYIFDFAALQHHLRVEIPGIGLLDGHPDVILTTGLYDVKTSRKAKSLDAAATSYTELGLYALMREAETGDPVAEVGYWTWVRTKRPYWQIVTAPVTDSMRRIAWARTAAYVRALEADAVLNAGLAEPVNGTFPNGPRFASLCSDCVFNPAFGGPCEIAGEQEEAA